MNRQKQFVQAQLVMKDEYECSAISKLESGRIKSSSVMKTVSICYYISIIIVCFTFLVSSRESVYAEDVLAKGSYNDRITWIIYSDGEMSIVGEGTMDTISVYPWVEYSSDVYKLTISEGITNIPENSFIGFDKLRELSLPSTLRVIGNDAFRYCNNLSDVTLPDGINRIGTGFRSCSGLRSINLPSSLAGLAEYAFSGCDNLERIDIPEGIREIPKQSFCCDNLKYVTLPNTLEVIGSQAFQGDAIEYIDIPESVKTIDFQAFAKTNLQSITLHDGLETIGQRAFSVTPLTSISIPSSVTRIANQAFMKCESLSFVSVEEGAIAAIGEYAFQNCSSLSDVSLSSGIYYIGSSAFEGCSSLRNIEIPALVSELYDKTFYNSGLEEILIPCCVEKVSSKLVDNSIIQMHVYGALGTEAEVFASRMNFEFIPTEDAHFWDYEYTTDTKPTEDCEGVESIHCLFCDTIKSGSSRTIPRLDVDIKKCSISLKSRYYTGLTVYPDITITYKGTTLVADQDYTTTTTNNVNVGKASVVVVGKGQYKGTVSTSFSILPKSISPAISLSKTSYYYDGMTKTPSVTVKDGGTTLSTADYEVTYSGGRKNVGTYKVIVELKGNYAGSKTATFTIKKAKQPMTVKAKTVSLKASKLKKKAQTVKISKAVTIKKAQGTKTYKITSKGKLKKVKIDKKTGKITVPKGTKKGTYTIKIKVTAAGTKNYKKGSKTVAVKIKVK